MAESKVNMAEKDLKDKPEEKVETSPEAEDKLEAGQETTEYVPVYKRTKVEEIEDSSSEMTDSSDIDEGVDGFRAVMIRRIYRGEMTDGLMESIKLEFEELQENAFEWDSLKERYPDLTTFLVHVFKPE